MSAFGGLILTNKGRSLQAKAQIGTALNFTRIAVGDGDLSGSSILDLNALKHEVKSLSIVKLKVISGGKATVGSIFSNENLVSGFYWREIGVFAQDPDDGEILYCYGNAGANAEYIAAGGGADIIEKRLDVITLVGNATSVNANIEQSLVFATLDYVDESYNSLLSMLGDKSTLTTADKSSIVNAIIELVSTKLDKAGDSMSGLLTFANDKGIFGKTTGGTAYNLLRLDTTDSLALGNVNIAAQLNSKGNPRFNIDGTVQNAWHDGNNASNKAANGYQKLASGLIIQWGRIQNTNGTGGVQVNYPIQFPTAVCSCVAFAFDSTLDGTTGAYTWANNSHNIANFYVRSTKASYIDWIAIGY
jgi:hypothetical protein